MSEWHEGREEVDLAAFSDGVMIPSTWSSSAMYIPYRKAWRSHSIQIQHVPSSKRAFQQRHSAFGFTSQT